MIDDRPVLVTGANGFIGSHLVDELLARGRRVRALVRRGSDLTWLDPRAERVIGDVTSPLSLPAAVRGVGAVYHVAGVVARHRNADYYEVNEQGTRSLMLAVRKSAPDLRRFILVSSLAAAGPARGGRPLRESDRPRPVCPYGSSKLAGERAAYAAADGIPVTVVRPPWVYGPRDDNFLTVYKMVFRGRTLAFTREKFYSFVHVRDLVRGTVDAGTAAAGRDRTYYFAEPRAYAFSAVLERMARALGVDLKGIRVPAPLLRLLGPVVDTLLPQLGIPSRPLDGKCRQAQADYWVVDTERARTELGFEIRTPLAKGLPATVEFYRRAGWIPGLV